MKEDTSRWSAEKLARKAEQAWEMAGLARRDGDQKDAARYTDLAKGYDTELSRRAGGS